MLQNRPLVLLPVFLLLASATPVAAQRVVDRPLRVYLDCNRFRCDQDFYTQEIPWVDFVRDRQVADVHVLGTRQSTGAGGSAYALEFQGRGGFEAERLTLRTTTPPDATESARRDELLRVFRLGLAPFAAGSAVSPSAEFTLEEAEAEDAAPQDDPWNRWVFRVGVNGFTNGESQQNFLNGSGSASASRVTEEWKLSTYVRGSVNRSEFEVETADTDTTIVSQRESYSAEAQAVKSLGEHWGAGLIGQWNRSTYNNYEHSMAFGPAIEYNLFPYSESTRRVLTLSYAIGPRYNVYQDSTLFGEKAELLIHQIAVLSYDVTQPWGEIDVRATFDQYLAKFSEGVDWDEPQYNLELSGGFDVRLIQGLSARVHGSVGMVRGQIQLPAVGLTEEEILTQQRELATDYRYFMSFGLSYRFGSIFSDVVNPRFESF